MNPQAPWTHDLYEELRRTAESLMGREAGGHTLQPTALAHETWLRLLQSRNAGDLDRAAFVRVAAQAMRRILTDHARRKGASKRGGELRRTTLAGKALELAPVEFAWELNTALEALQLVDADLVRLVELRFYCGCSTAEIAEAMGTSERTVKRRWRFARAWLQEYMSEEES